MSKRTLSDSELHAQSKNRHAQRHLKLQLEQLKQSEIQLRENTRAETEKWMQFRRSNLRNSGWCPEALGVGEEDFEDVVFLEIPGSPTVVKARSDLNGSEKFQRPWAYTYSARSHNKLYNDLLHSADNNKKKLGLFGKGDKTPRLTADQPKLAQQVPAVTGIERAKTAWGRRTKLLSARDSPPRPHTAVENDATSVEFSELDITRNANASWGSLAHSVTRVKNAWSPRRKFLPDQEEDSDAPTDYTPRLAKSVSAFQELLRSRDIWKCSVCGGDKRSKEEEQTFSSVACMARGVVRATTALRKITSSETVSTTIYPEDPPRSPVSAGRKMKCGCLKRAPVSEAWTNNVRADVDGQNGRLSPIRTSSSDENASTPTPRSETLDKETCSKPLPANRKLNCKKTLSNGKAKSTGHSESVLKGKGRNRASSKEEANGTSGVNGEDLTRQVQDNGSTKALGKTPTEERMKNGKEGRVPSVLENAGTLESLDPKHKRKRRMGVVHNPPFTSGKNGNMKKDTVSIADLALDLPNVPSTSTTRGRKISPSAQTKGNVEQTNNDSFGLGKDEALKEDSDTMLHSRRDERDRNFTRDLLQKEQSDYLEKTSFASQEDELNIGNGDGSDGVAEKNAKKITGNVPDSDQPVRGKEIDTVNGGDRKKEGGDVVVTVACTTAAPRECSSNSCSSCHEGQLQKEAESAAVKNVSAANGVTDLIESGSAVSKLPLQEIQGADKISGAASVTTPTSKHMEVVAGEVIKIQRSGSKFSAGRRMSWKNARNRMKNVRMHEENVFVKIAKAMQARRVSRRPHTTTPACTNTADDVSDVIQRPNTTGNSTPGFDENALIRKKSSINSSDGSMHDKSPNQSVIRRGRQGDSLASDCSDKKDDGSKQGNHQRMSVSSDGSFRARNSTGRENAKNYLENEEGNVLNDKPKRKDSTSKNKSYSVDHSFTDISGNNNYNNNNNNNNNNVNIPPNSVTVSADNSSTNVNNDNDNNIANNNNNSSYNNLDNGTVEETYTSSKNISVLDYDNRDLEVVGFPSKQVFHRGVRIRNYVAPQERYKTQARDRHKRMVSVRWNSAEGAVVTEQKITEKPGLVDVVFPKQARQRALTKLVEENHSKPANHAAEMADAALRTRISQFLESVQPYCKQ